MQRALPKRYDDRRAGPSPSNRKMRLFWDPIRSHNTSVVGWVSGGCGWSDADIKKTECVCVSVCVSVREKKGIKVKWREAKSDVRGATGEG